METQCPNCRAVFDVEDEYNGQAVDCPDCGKNFIIHPHQHATLTKVVHAEVTTTTPAASQKPPFQQTIIMNQPPEKKSSAGCAAWVLLAVAAIVQFFTLYLVAFPIYLAAFIVGIVAMCKGKVLSGIMVILGTILVPILIAFVFFGMIAAARSTAVSLKHAKEAEQKVQAESMYREQLGQQPRTIPNQN